LILLSSCSLNKVILHHGIHNLEKKQAKLKINVTNKNEIVELFGPPSTKSTFDNDVYIYMERKTSSSKLRNLGKKEINKK
jgi:outer membrane protein assembly factor BamE (lipoprotein component of BamABCDE complex)